MFLIALIIFLVIMLIIKTKSSHSSDLHVQANTSINFCSNCGAEVHTNAVVCVKCGCAVASRYTTTDIPSAGLNILSFFFPLIGLILFLVYNEKSPRKAKGTGIAALIGFIIGVIGFIITIATL